MKHTLNELKLKHGELVSPEVIEEIKFSYYITKHAREQLVKRSDMLVEFYPGKMDVSTTKKNINKMIDNNILAYYNTDGSINIALNEWNYFVFVYDEQKDNWSLVTYKEKSWYSKTIFEKRQMAIDGFDRKY